MSDVGLKFRRMVKAGEFNFASGQHGESRFKAVEVCEIAQGDRVEWKELE